jgi:hypothetical protein
MKRRNTIIRNRKTRERDGNRSADADEWYKMEDVIQVVRGTPGLAGDTGVVRMSGQTTDFVCERPDPRLRTVFLRIRITSLFRNRTYSGRTWLLRLSE